MLELADWVMRQRARREIERRPVRADLVRLLLRWSEIRRGIARGQLDPTPHMAGLSRFPWLLPLYRSVRLNMLPVTPGLKGALDRFRRPQRTRLLSVLVARMNQRRALPFSVWCPATHEEQQAPCIIGIDNSVRIGSSHWRTQGAPMPTWPTECGCWFCWHHKGRVTLAISGLRYSQRYLCAGHLAELERRAAGGEVPTHPLELL